MATADGYFQNQNMANFDDMDMYFDFNQAIQSPSQSTSKHASISNSAFSNEHADDPQVLAGPSHEYDRFKQQTGLPNGAMSNVTAFNDMNSEYRFEGQGRIGLGSSEYDPSMGYNSGIGMDMDFSGGANGMQAYYFTQESSSMNMDEFIDPTAIDGDAPPPAANRLWPGMHSQQAEQARAEAQAKQEQQQLMGQRIMRQKQQQQAAANSSRASLSSQGGRRGSQSSSDPHVEESISRVLDQMRHNSRVSPIDEEDDSPNGLNESGRSGRSRKEEDDMDEDEKLLASEEGKKLSSKERRQLRNKVSARAFRSRRKEYISQLEGEVAAKQNECNELKARNRNLMDQNAQLTQLTQTLLRHPAFSTFLQDMSNDPSILSNLQAQSALASQGSQTPTQLDQDAQEEQKPDISEESTQVGMTMMPQTNFDFSMLNLGNNHWGAGHVGTNFQQPQVFALYDMPELPTLDELLPRRNLSEKDEEYKEKISSDVAPKLDYPVLSADLPILKEPEKQMLPVVPSVSDIEDGSASLDDDSFPAALQEIPVLQSTSLSGKPSNRFTLVTPSSTSPETAMVQIEQMFSQLEPIYRRIESLTSHLPANI